MPNDNGPISPRVFLVGAGPGDPGLITLRGAQCLAQADLVLYDALVNPRILALAPAHAERVTLGRHGRGRRLMAQDEVHRRMVAAAQTGRIVVRLKSGDPAVFARMAEEVAALRAAGIAFEVVPGITAALAAGSHAGVPLTHRDLSSAVALVTGHEQDCKDAPDLDYAGLAVFPGTLVLYMGVTTAPEWTTALIAAGKDASTPAAIVRRCTWPDQTVIRTTLGSVAREMDERRVRPPAIVIVGPVAALESEVGWFAERPLVRRRVLVTRPHVTGDPTPDPLVDALLAAGADVIVQPAIELSEPHDWAPVDAAIQRLHEYDWIVFSSVNGVRFFTDRVWQTGGDLRSLGRVKIAAIGSGTAERLAALKLRADLVPEEYRAEALAVALAPHAAGKRVLLVRASRGREVLAETLRAAEVDVTQVIAYQSIDVATPGAEALEALASGSIDWVTVTSSAIARSLVKLFGEHLRRARLVSISPVTSAVLRELGYPPALEATEYTTDGLARVLLRAPSDD